MKCNLGPAKSTKSRENVVAFLMYYITITMFLDEEDRGVCKILYLWWVKMENLEFSCGKYGDKFSQCDRY
jgi:hypothetical protein